MKKVTLAILLTLLSSTSFAGKIPAVITDDFMKTNAIELLIANIKEFYQITDFLGGRTNESNGKEIALGIVQFVKTNNECKKIVAAIRQDNCQTAEKCEVEGYLIDCDKTVESLFN